MKKSILATDRFHCNLWAPCLLLMCMIFTLSACKKEDDQNDTLLTDIDGNVYHIITIGNHIWMAENLKTTRYKNGSTIINVAEDGIGWSNLTTGAWCYYNNDSALNRDYGKLYNWHAVNNSNGICPEGWHVPSDSVWTELTDFLGGATVAGGKMKEPGTGHWNSPNTNASNQSGFTGLPGGLRGVGGNFSDMGLAGNWWTATSVSAGSAWNRNLYCGSASISRGSYNKTFGYSVRCIKD